MQQRQLPLFESKLEQHGQPSLLSRAPSTLQINVGRVCNQACLHCHVEAGPNRKEDMGEAVVDRIKMLLATSACIKTVDITGGAPELNKHFRELVRFARERGLQVIDRCNLTILSEPGMQDLADFLAEQQVHVIASMPCYSELNVDRQRGKGVFARSLEGIRSLNQRGYGIVDSGLRLDLVYNPGGAFLPPAQEALEQDYRRELAASGLHFNSLLTLTNMPIGRFARDLRRDGTLSSYQSLLVENFNASTVSELMCVSMVSVSYDGRFFDCDFNQMLDLSVAESSTKTLWDIGRFEELAGRAIQTRSHCFGCTAGAGSSCGGALR